MKGCLIMKKKIKIVFLLFITIFIVCTVFFFFNAAKLTIKDAKLYSLVGGSINKYAGNVTLKYNKDNTSELSSPVSKLKVDSSPIYYENMKKIVLPQSMAIVLYNQSKKMFKLNYFSTITQKDGLLQIEDKGFSSHRSNFFLFDGHDTYVFFETTKITYGKENIVLPAFSFVKSIYNNKLSVFNFDTREYHEYPIKGVKVSAQLEFGNSVDLNTDTVISGNKDQVLLIKQIQDLKNIE